MNSHDYIKQALRTESIKNATSDLRLLHGAIGLSTEANELLGVMKERTFYGTPLGALEIQNIYEELGDLFWYAAIICDVLGFNFEDIMADNIEKLRKRYPDKWTKENAVNRNKEDELEHIMLPMLACGCGGTAKLSVGKQRSSKKSYWAWCSSCGYSTENYITKIEAVDAWNQYQKQKSSQ